MLQKTNDQYFVKNVKRDLLFFNKWKYCLKLDRIDRAFIMRDCFTNGKNALSSEKKHKLVQSRVEHWKHYTAGTTEFKYPIEAELAHQLIDSLDGNSCYQASIEYDRINFYFNDQTIIDTIIQAYRTVGYSRKAFLQVVDVMGGPGVKTLKFSRFKYRTYLNENNSDAQVKIIFNWLANQGDTIEPSPSLSYRINNDEYVICRHYFFDHNETKLLSFLDIVNIKARRKTYDIKARHYFTK